MKISNEQIKKMIQEELEEVLKEMDEAYSKKYGTGEDYTQRKARQSKLKKAQGINKPDGEAQRILTPIEELEAHMTIAALRGSSNRARVSQKVYDYIKKIAPAILNRVEIKE